MQSSLKKKKKRTLKGFMGSFITLNAKILIQNLKGGMMNTTINEAYNKKVRKKLVCLSQSGCMMLVYYKKTYFCQRKLRGELKFHH